MSLISKLKKRLGSGDLIRRNDVQLIRPGYALRHEGCDMLVLGTGSSILDYQNEIRAFSETENLVVIGVNNAFEMFSLDYVGFTNRDRFSTFGRRQASESTRALLSIYFTDEQIKKWCNMSHDLVMWRDTRNPNVCAIDEDGIISQHGSVGTLMVLVAYVMGARRVYVAGMDGADESQLTHENIHFRTIDYKPYLTEKEREKKYRHWLTDILPQTFAAIHAWNVSIGRTPFVSLTPTYYGDYFDPNLLGIR